MQHLAEHWADIRVALEVFLIAGAGVVAIIIAVKWKIPMLSKAIERLTKRVEKLEKVSHQQDINKTDLIDYVKKTELYRPNGEARFMAQHACALNQENCQKIIGKDIRSLERKVCEVGDQLTAYQKKQDEQKTELVAVQKDMIAVATQLRDVIALDRKEELKELATMIVDKINGNTK